MSKLSARKRRVKRTVSIGKVAPEAVGQVEDLDGRIEAIQTGVLGAITSNYDSKPYTMFD